MKSATAERVSVVAIILLGVALSLNWLFRVPMFQQPDENLHADYAFTIFTAGRVVRPGEGRPVSEAHPLVRYLERVSGFHLMRYNYAARAPAGYGSREFYRATDANAPAVPRDFVALSGERPGLVGAYPFLYYSLDALFIGLGAALTQGSASAEFFFARGFSVVLLAISLTLSYLILRELHLPLRFRLGILAVIAWFPLTTWVSAYVQPDNLAFTGVSLALLLTLKARKNPSDSRYLWLLSATLGCLWLTKSQYFSAVAPVAIACVLSAASLKPRKRSYWIATGCILLAGPLVAFGLSRYESFDAAGAARGFFGGGYGSPFATALSQGALPLITFVKEDLWRAFVSTFIWGGGLFTYWSGYTWLNSPIFNRPLAYYLPLWATISTASLTVSVAMIVRSLRVAWRIGGIARRRTIASAARLAFSDVILNSYLLFAAIVFAVYVLSNGQLGQYGRYWLPFEVASVLCAVYYAPRMLSRRLARKVAVFNLIAMLAYCIAAVVAEPFTLTTRFYEPPRHPRPDLEGMAYIDRLDGRTIPAGSSVQPPLRDVYRGALSVEGWAVDSRAGEPARRVDLVVDGKLRLHTRYGLPACDHLMEIAFNDTDLLQCGFSTTIDVSRLAPGSHELSLLIYEQDRAQPYPSEQKIWLRLPVRSD